MSQIETLYNIARIQKYGKRQCKDNEYLECQNYCFCDMDNKCDKFVVEYPPFTAEKQIKLIKWLAIKDCMFKVTYEREFLWCSQLEWQSSFCYESFEESLANLINTLWQDLTEEDRRQIKEMLE